MSRYPPGYWSREALFARVGRHQERFCNRVKSDADCFVRSTGQIESNYDETTDSFDAMNLKPELLRGVYAYGFERPSAIQQRAIMPVIKGE